MKKRTNVLAIILAGQSSHLNEQFRLTIQEGAISIVNQVVRTVAQCVTPRLIAVAVNNTIGHDTQRSISNKSVRGYCYANQNGVPLATQPIIQASLDWATLELKNERSKPSQVLLIAGDTPLLPVEALEQLLHKQAQNKKGVSVLTTGSSKKEHKTSNGTFSVRPISALLCRRDWLESNISQIPQTHGDMLQPVVMHAQTDAVEINEVTLKESWHAGYAASKKEVYPLGLMRYNMHQDQFADHKAKWDNDHGSGL